MAADVNVGDDECAGPHDAVDMAVDTTINQESSTEDEAFRKAKAKGKEYLYRHADHPFQKRRIKLANLFTVPFSRELGLRAYATPPKQVNPGNLDVSQDEDETETKA